MDDRGPAMGKHNAGSANRDRSSRLGMKLLGGLALGAAAPGAVALVMAAPASATCLAGGGVSVGSGCDATMTSFAIGLGPNTVASAGGTRNVAVAFGRGAFAQAGSDRTDTRDSAMSLGRSARAYATDGSHNTALAVGDRVPLGDGEYSDTEADATLGDHNKATAIGNGTYAFTRWGDHNTVSATGTMSQAYAGFGGSHNRAVILGDNSLASAGGDQEEPGHSDHNVATVTGNTSRATAGPGSNNHVHITGNGITRSKP